MATNSLYPSFIQIHYRSSYGKHVQTLPTRAWSAGVGSHGFGGYETWGGSSIDADSMVNAFLAVVTPWTDTDVVWDEAIVFNYPAVPPALPNPVALFGLTAVGAATTAAASQALQSTFNFYDTLFNTFKLVFLDCDTTGSFTPQNYSQITALKQDTVDYILSDLHAFQSRADRQPAVFRQLVSKYNDKLRKEYHLN